jgi:hypothetical protein
MVYFELNEIDNNPADIEFLCNFDIMVSKPHDQPLSHLSLVSLEATEQAGLVAKANSVE